MKIETNDKIKVHAGNKCMLDASAQDILSVALWAQPKYQLPTMLRKLFNLNNDIEFIMLDAVDGDVTLRSSDYGFDDALKWLSDKGWEISKAADRARAEPYVRHKAVRVSA